MIFQLPGGEPLFTLLFQFALEMNREQQPARVIGGLAMYFWHQEMDGIPRGTADIDSVFLSSEWPSLEEARPQILALDRILRSLGLQPDRGENWRASRTARFTYLIPGEEPRIEILCGTLNFGKRSRRLPAWRLLSTEDNQTIYASRLEVLDDLPPWRTITIESEGVRATIEIPTIPGMIHLKLKAVVDKLERYALERYAEETEQRKRDHEYARLGRHASDLISLLTWARSTPETLARFTALARSTPSIPSRIQSLRAWIETSPPPPELADLYLQLRRATVNL